MGWPEITKTKLTAWFLLAFAVIERIVGWGGSVDFIIARSEEPGWVGNMWAALQSGSPLFGVIATLVGIYLLTKNDEKRIERMIDERMISASQLSAQPYAENIDHTALKPPVSETPENPLPFRLAAHVYEAAFCFNTWSPNHKVTFILSGVNTGDDPIELLPPFGGAIAYRGRVFEGPGVMFSLLPFATDDVTVTLRGVPFFMNCILHFQNGPQDMEQLLTWFAEGDVSFDTAGTNFFARSTVTQERLTLNIGARQLIQNRRDLKTQPVITASATVRI